MPTRFITELLADQICDSPEHDPPPQKQPGLYEHVCPKCHKVTRFTVGYDPRADRERFFGGFDGASP